MAGAGDYDRIHVIGVPLDHGAGRRGVGVGPSAIRIAGLHGILNRIGHQLVDHGDLIIAAPETQQQEHVNAKYLTLISRTCEQLCESVADVLDQGGFPLIIGGDHSMSIGSVSGIATHMHNQEPALDVRRLGVIWFDAHGDINTPDSSPSGNIHGMPVACLLGKGPKSLTEIGYAGPKVAPARFVQIGIRDIDDNERHLLADAGILVLCPFLPDFSTMRVEPTLGPDAERAFDRDWARETTAAAVRELGAEWAERGRADQFEVLRPLLMGEGPPRSELADATGMTENALAVTIHRLRQRYAALVREAVAQTVADERDIEDEMRYLVSVLREE